MQRYHTVIIGAGFAGLAAARTLLREGVRDFVVLEARDRVGGRTKSGKLAGLDIDLGGMWLGPTQTRLKALAEEYGVGTYPTFLDGDAIYRIQGKEHRGARESIDGLFGILDGLQYLGVRRKLERLAEGVDCEQPWAHPDAEHLDSLTLEGWMRANVRSPKLRQLFRMACFSLFCAEASQVSMLFYLQYIKSGDDFDTIVSADRGGAQNFAFHGGVHQIAEKMASELGDRLVLGSPVRRVAWSLDGGAGDGPDGDDADGDGPDGDHAEITAGGDRYQAKNVIVAIPPTLVPRIEFSPELPQPMAAWHSRLAMGSVIKFWVAYERPFWRDRGLNGLVLQDDSPATPIFDVSPPGQELGVLVGFFDGDHALNHGDQSTEERRKLVLDTISSHFGEQGRQALDYSDNDWTAEEWSGGCYGAYAAPGLLSRYGAWSRHPVGPIRWAGTETSARWTGYIEGAIRSGEREARSILGKQAP